MHQGASYIISNASEACAGMENAEITLKTNYKAPYLTVSCENPVSMKDKEKQRRMQSMVLSMSKQYVFMSNPQIRKESSDPG